MKSTTGKVLCREEISSNGNILNSKFLLEMKDKCTNKVRWKAGVVFYGQRDNMKTSYYTTFQ